MKTEFNFVVVREKVVNETKDRYIMKSTKKPISEKQAENYLRKGVWGGFKKYAFGFKNKKYYYGMKKLPSFNTLLKEISKHSKRKKATLRLYINT